MTPDTFQRIVHSEKDRIYGYAAWLLGDREEARDIAQEALVRLWEHRDSIRTETAGGWLTRTTHHLCVDRIRRRRARTPGRTVSLSESDNGAPNGRRATFDPGVAPDRAADRREEHAALQAALASLTLRDRAVIILRDVQGLSYRDLAEVMEMPVGSAKAAVHRARQRLRREVDARQEVRS